MIGRAVRCSSGRPTPPRPGRSGRPLPSSWAAGFFPVLIGAAVLIGPRYSRRAEEKPGRTAQAVHSGFFVSAADRGGGGSFPVLIGAGAVWHWFRLHLIHPHGAPGTGPAGTVPGRHSFAAG